MQYCCSYGTKYSKETYAYDCAIIPDPIKTDGTTLAIGAYGFCGGELSVTNEATAAKTVCCNNYFIHTLFQKVQINEKMPFQQKKCLSTSGF